MSSAKSSGKDVSPPNRSSVSSVSSVSSTSSPESVEKQPAEYLLEKLFETVYHQLGCAKEMDVDGLQESTHRRQDLLFQLDLEVPHTQKTDYLEELQQAIAAMDERLMVVLEVVNDACRITNPSKSPDTYTSKGTISGYKI